MSVAKRIAMFIVFLFVNVINVGYDGFLNSAPFSSILTVAIPLNHETGTIIFTKFLLSIVISVVFLFSLTECINEQFQMGNYILTRGTRIKSVKFYAKRIVIGALRVFVLKLVADALVGNYEICCDYRNVIIVEISTIVTVLLWGGCMTLLFVVEMDQRLATLVTVTAVVIIQWFSLYGLCPVLTSIIVIGSPIILVAPFQILALKLSLIVTLYLTSIAMFKKYEFCGLHESI